MSLSLNQLFWAVLLLGGAIAIAYWLGHRSAGQVTASKPVQPEPIAQRAPAPTAAPPPANAGGAHHPGPVEAPRPMQSAAPPIRPANDVNPESRPLPRTPTAVPPPAAAAVAPAARRAAAAAPAQSRSGRRALTSVASWGYQLQKIDIAKAAASPFDLLVVDYSRDGSAENALTPAEVARLQQKPDGSRRLVIAYISIGEAESYRYYWDDAWKRTKPRWLLGENPEWEENYSVCFWEPEWQALMCGSREAYVDRIMAAGFDGIYLDKCDVYEDLQRHFRKVADTRPAIERDMIGFVERISRHARSKDPGFLVVMQNAEGLLEHKATIGLIDAVAKESLIYGAEVSEKINAREEFEYAQEQLDKVKAAGKPVLVVEYLNSPAKIREAATLCERLGYVLYISPKDRELDKLNYDVLEA